MGGKIKQLDSVITSLLCDLANCIYETDRYHEIQEQLLEKLDNIDASTLKLSRLRDRIKYALIEKGSFSSHNLPN